MPSSLKPLIPLVLITGALLTPPGALATSEGARAPMTDMPTLDDVLAARDRGDVQTLERAFERLEIALKEGEITSRRYIRPWLAFSTGNPDHRRMLDDWSETFPRSPHPHAAKGRTAYYVARIFRGEATTARTPRGAMKHARSEFAKAAAHFADAMARRPDHFAAAKGVHNVAPHGHRKSLRYAAERVLQQYMDKLDLMRSTVWTKMPQWGGSAEETVGYCTEAAAESDGAFTGDECLAVALTHGRTGKSRAEGYKRLTTAGEDRFLPEIADGFVFKRETEKIKELLERTGFIFWPREMLELPILPDQLRRHLTFWAKIDDGNPFIAQVGGRLAAVEGDVDRAADLFEHSFEVNPFREEIHQDRLKLFLIMRRYEKVLPAMEVTAKVMDGQAEGFIPTMMPVLDNLDFFSTGANGEEHENYACRLVALIETAEEWCTDTGGYPTYCSVATTRPVDDMTDQLRRNRAIWRDGSAQVRAACEAQ